MSLFRKPSALRGFVAGAIGGFVGTAALDLFKQALMHGSRQAETLAGMPHRYSDQQEEQTKKYDHAHAQTAETLAELTGTTLTLPQKRAATPVTHFLFGTLCGGLYGAVAEYAPSVKLGAGTAFGSAVFAVGNEAVLPALNLLPQALETPPVLHLEGFASHAIYGAATESIRRLVRPRL